MNKPPLNHEPETFAAAVIRYRWVALMVGCLSLIPLAWGQSGLRMNRSLASMFSADDPVLRDYQLLQRTFGGNLVVMIVYDDDQLMTPAGLRRSRQWSERVEQVEGVEGVLSIAKLVDAFAFLRPQLPFSLPGGLGAGFGAGLGGESAADGEASDIALFDRDDPIATDFRELFAGYTHGPDEKTAAIVAMLRPGEGGATVQRLRELTEPLRGEFDVTLVGEPVLLDDAFDMIIADGRRLAIGTIGLLSIVILVVLRDLRVVALSALCIVWSTLATRCVMVAFGIEMSLVSTILIAIIAVIVVASVMHIGTARTLRRVNLFRALSVLSVPIACTCLTDAAGFVSLAISDVRPVVQFGVMTATAAISVLVSLSLFTAALMSIPDRWAGFRRSTGDAASASRADSRTDRRIGWVLESIARWSVLHRRKLGWASIALTLLALGYVVNLETNSSFLDNFRSDSRIVAAYERVERRLGGAGVWDVVLDAPDPITPGYLAEVRDLESRLRAISVNMPDGRAVGLSKVLSLADADAVAGRVRLLSFLSPEVRLEGMRSTIPTFAEALLTFPRSGNGSDGQAASESDSASESAPPNSQRRLRIMLRSEERLPGPTKQALLNEVIETASSWHVERSRDLDDAVRIPPIVTGYSVLMSRLVASLVRDQWKALGVALASIGLLIGLMTQRLSETLAALIVNLLPILAVLSVLGWLGGRLDLGSAMIGAVSIGLSIDGSVHFLSGYRRNLTELASTGTAVTGPAALGVENGSEMGPVDSRGRSAKDPVIEAAVTAASDLATPILLATVALVIGFGVLVTSPFVPTSTFGLLVACTLASSAIANLTLLPAMVVWWSRPDAAPRRISIEDSS